MVCHIILGGVVSLVSACKSYICATYLLSKPLLSYITIRISWLMGVSIIEWYSGRLYSIHCIGEGFTGFYNHIWNLASPACTGLLTTHISLMGVLVASFVISFLWGIVILFNKFKQNNISNDILKEYHELKNLVYKS